MNLKQNNEYNLTNDEKIRIYTEYNLTPEGKRILEDLKNKIKYGLVSAFIGAGFSKNAHGDFPLWNDLLKDMILELYNYSNEDNEDDFVKKIINSEGYLNIVDKYIDIKGIRESLTIYIEDRIKYINYNKAELQLDLHKKLLEIPWNNVYTTNYDTLLEDADEENKYTLITKASDLSLNRTTRRIIKLHGTLRKNDDDEYGFDEDLNLNYIISKKDYETYPEKHSAFTHLMRISLLQECFCLIGFSGDDPNFISWLQWVKDILKGTSDKIYLIGIAKEELSKDKNLFYKNNGINYISLYNVFENVEDKSPRELIELFLNQLQNGNITEKFEMDSLKIKINKYFQFQNESLNILKLKNHIPSDYILFYYFIYCSTNFLLENRKNILKNIKENHKYIELLIFLLAKSYLTLDSIYNEKQMHIVLDYLKGIEDKNIKEQLILNISKYYRNTLKMKELENLKKNTYENKIKENIEYDYFIASLSSGEFEKTKDLIVNWNCKEAIGCIRKIFLEQLLGENNYKKNLNKLENLRENCTDSYLKLLTLQLEKYMVKSNHESLNKSSQIELDRYSNEEFESLTKLLKELEFSAPEKKDVIPYRTKYTVTSSFSFNNELNTNLIKTHQFKELIISLGIPIIQNFGIITDKKNMESYLKILGEENINQHFLFMIFYLNGNGEEKFVKKIGQDLIYSNKINLDDKEKYLDLLLKYLNYHLESNILNDGFVMLLELIEITKSDNWELYIEKLWNKIKESDSLNKTFYDKRFQYNLIFNNVIKYIKNNDLLKELLFNILKSNIRFGEYLTIINILFNNNLIFSSKDKKELQRIFYTMPINEFVLDIIRIIYKKINLDVNKLISKIENIDNLHELYYELLIIFEKNKEMKNKVKNDILLNLEKVYPLDLNFYINNKSNYLSIHSLNKHIIFNDSENKKIASHLEKVCQIAIENWDRVLHMSFAKETWFEFVVQVIKPFKKIYSSPSLVNIKICLEKFDLLLTEQKEKFRKNKSLGINLMYIFKNLVMSKEKDDEFTKDFLYKILFDCENEEIGMNLELLAYLLRNNTINLSVNKKIILNILEVMLEKRFELGRLYIEKNCITISLLLKKKYKINSEILEEWFKVLETTEYNSLKLLSEN